VEYVNPVDVIRKPVKDFADEDIMRIEIHQKSMELINLLEKDLKLLSLIKSVVHMLFNKLLFNIIEISIFK
jgi:hypothetical protein